MTTSEHRREADAAYLRGFLGHLIGFAWSEALIDSAFVFSIEIEREIARLEAVTS